VHEDDIEYPQNVFMENSSSSFIDSNAMFCPDAVV
jgi:hypothetical protein